MTCDQPRSRALSIYVLFVHDVKVWGFDSPPGLTHRSSWERGENPIRLNVQLLSDAPSFVLIVEEKQKKAKSKIQNHIPL